MNKLTIWLQSAFFVLLLLNVTYDEPMIYLLLFVSKIHGNIFYGLVVFKTIFYVFSFEEKKKSSVHIAQSQTAIDH